MVGRDVFKRSGTDTAAVPLDDVGLSDDYAVWLASPEAAFLNGRYCLGELGCRRAQGRIW
ncbi:hypothetical protein BDW62DRAFT_178937 [Aspergillus aurantiobrunneus]